MNTAAAYMVSLGLSDETASTLRSQYYTQYGLTLRGLRRHHGVGSTAFSLSLSLSWQGIDSVPGRSLWSMTKSVMARYLSKTYLHLIHTRGSCWRILTVLNAVYGP